MSALLKLENAYLTILRIVVLVAATITLLGAACIGIAGFLNMRDVTRTELVAPKIDPQDVVKQMIEARRASASTSAVGQRPISVGFN